MIGVSDEALDHFIKNNKSFLFLETFSGIKQAIRRNKSIAEICSVNSKDVIATIEKEGWENALSSSLGFFESEDKFELCKLDLEQLYKNGKRRLGIVFNLDPHDMPGSHWVSLFVNMNNGGIYFYDSVGKFPNKEISDLMFRIRSQGNELIKKD